MRDIPIKTIERLVRYRRVLNEQLELGKTHVFSHELAALLDITPAQVRRDLMSIAHSGSPSKGYEIIKLREDIAGIMDHPAGQKIAMTGLGNLGRAILTYFTGRRPRLSIVAAFDIDPQKIGRVYAGCRCYDVSQMEEIIEKEKITIGIVTVPAPEAQKVVDRYVRAGIRAIVNWAPTPLRVPENVFLETRDIILSIEKAAYLAKIR